MKMLTVPSVEAHPTPHDERLERAVLGALLLEPSSHAAREATRLLPDPDAFYKPEHRRIYQAVLALREQGKQTDMLSVTHEMRRTDTLTEIGGPSTLFGLTQNVATTSSLVQHAALLAEFWMKRRVGQMAATLWRNAHEPDVDAFEALDLAQVQLADLGIQRLTTASHTIGSLLPDTAERLLQAAASGSGITGVPTGLRGLDRALGGLQPTDLVILAARPAMGKTSLALQIARNVALDAGTPVALFSLEMGLHQLNTRLIALESRTPVEDLLRGRLGVDGTTAAITRAQALLTDKLVLDETSSLSLQALRAKAFQMVERQGVGLILIDYLQLMTLEGRREQTRDLEIGRISRGLKALAKELNVPVVALAQLSRKVEERADRKPQLSDLRESGSIEQDADVVTFLFRPEYYKITEYDDGTPTRDTAMVIISKNRNGATGEVLLGARMSCGHFFDLTAEHVTPRQTPGPDPRSGEHRDEYRPLAGLTNSNDFDTRNPRAPRNTRIGQVPDPEAPPF